MTVCRLKIDPSEIAAPVTRAAQIARYAAVRARLNNPRIVLGDDAGAHVAAWITQRDHNWMIPRYLPSAGWPETMLAKHRPGKIFIQDPEIDDPAPRPKRYPSIKEIITAVAEHYDINIISLISQRRTKDVVRPRQVAMYLAREMTPRSLPEIGDRFDGRDHTTILHGVRVIERMLKSNTPLQADVIAIRERIGRYL